MSDAAHVELEMLGDACCDRSSDLNEVSAGTVEDYSTNAGTDCSHVQVTNWHYHSNQLQGKSIIRHMNVRSQTACVLTSALDGFGERTVDSRPLVDTLVPPLLLEHLSTSILIC